MDIFTTDFFNLMESDGVSTLRSQEVHPLVFNKILVFLKTFISLAFLKTNISLLH